MNKHLAATALLGLLTCALASAPADAAAIDGELNASVVRLAASLRGKRVGNGMCHDYVTGVLRRVGGRFGPNNKRWAYGRALRRGDRPRAGDVVLLEGARFSTLGGGTESYPNHVAILASVRGRQVVLLHQNHNDRKYVVATSLDLGRRTAGRVIYYRPRR